jgi:hypothetical protein
MDVYCWKGENAKYNGYVFFYLKASWENGWSEEEEEEEQEEEEDV